MHEWLSGNADTISALASIGTLTIWTVYLHIFWRSHRRQGTAKLMINAGEGRQLSARCFVTNMSERAVFIQSVIVDLRTPCGLHRAYISDAEDVRRAERPSDWKHLTRQGPVDPGKLVDMGSFETILDYAVHVSAGEEKFSESGLGQHVQEFEITVIGVYGSEDMLIGASRRFQIERSGGKPLLRSATVETHQITSSRERRRLAKELAEQL